jgi:hypothetical protein
MSWSESAWPRHGSSTAEPVTARFTALDNGFTTCEDPAGLQRLCDGHGPQAIPGFCERWWTRLPLPLTDADRAGGYWWDIAISQVEVSRTIVFAAPRHARGFFEALCTDNLDIGRPNRCRLPTVAWTKRVRMATAVDQSTSTRHGGPAL